MSRSLLRVHSAWSVPGASATHLFGIFDFVGALLTHSAKPAWKMCMTCGLSGNALVPSAPLHTEAQVDFGHSES